MDAAEFFKQKKGISMESAFSLHAKYTSVDVCRFAEKYHKEASKDLLEALQEMVKQTALRGYAGSTDYIKANEAINKALK
jgi:hypothetical protein